MGIRRLAWRRPVTVLAGVLAAVVVAAGVPAAAGAASATTWPQYGGDAQHTGTNPAEHAFNSGNIANAKVVSKAHLGDNTLDRGGPVVSNGRIYIGGIDGNLSVYDDAGCGADSCEPLWQGSIGDGSIDFTVAVADGLVLVDSANIHALFAFPAAGCGAKLCKPLWTGTMQDGATGSVTVSDGVAYVGDSGHLYAFRTAGCGRASCAPVWTGAGLTNESLDTPAVGGGFVYVDSFESTPDLFTGRLLAFRVAGCGAASCKPVWTADLGGPGTAVTFVGGNTAGTAGGTVFASSSTLFGDGTNTNYHLMAFAGSGCGGTVCKPVRSYFTGLGGFGIEGGLAVTGNTLLASGNDTTDASFIGGLFAYPLAGCGQAQCQPTWMGVSFANAKTSPPVVLDDVVLVAKGPASGFPVDSGFFSYHLKGCGASVCNPIALLHMGESQDYNGPPLAVADHKIFMASTDNTDNHSNVYTAALP